MINHIVQDVSGGVRSQVTIDRTFPVECGGDQIVVLLHLTYDVVHGADEALRLHALAEHVAARGLPVRVGPREVEVLLAAALHTDSEGGSLLSRDDIDDLLHCGGEGISHRLRVLRQADVDGLPLVREEGPRLIIHPRLLGIAPAADRTAV